MNPCCVEAQRNGEELGALDCPAHADHIAAMHDQLKCSCNYDRKGDVCGWHAEIVNSARQQARREAFEEAKAAMCPYCAEKRPLHDDPRGPYHTDVGRSLNWDHCKAAPLRALVEVER